LSSSSIRRFRSIRDALPLALVFGVAYGANLTVAFYA
jgi:hypothetical protein